MTKIVDPDQMTDGVEVVYSTSAKTVQYLIAGNLNDIAPGKSSGFTGQSGYSASKDHWLASTTLRKHRSPFDPVFDASYRMKDGWNFADQQSRDLWRDAGVQITATGQEFACILGLQEASDSDVLNYQNVFGFTESVNPFDKAGNLNELIEIFDGSANDYRDFLKVYNRQQGKIYSEGNLLVDQGLSALTFVAYRMPLGSSSDPNVTQTDVFIDGNAPYTGMSINFLKGSGYTTWGNTVVYPAGSVVLDSIRQVNGSTLGTWWFTPTGGTSSGTGTADDIGVTDWEQYVGEVQIGIEWFAYNRIIDGNGGTDIQVHEFSQRELRRTTNINDDGLGAPNQNTFGLVNGDVAIRLTQFAGGVKTFAGAYVTNLDASSRATAEFFDITVDQGGLDTFSVPFTSTGRTFPFSSAGDIVFSQNAVDEANVDTYFDVYLDYTLRQTNVDVSISGASGNTGILGSVNIDLSIFAIGDYFNLSGFTNGVNNGTMRATGAGTADSVAFEKSRNITDILINEVAGATVNVDDDPFDTDDAVILQDDTGTPITGQITQINEPFTASFDTNNQGNRIPATPIPITITASGLNDSKNVVNSFTIPRQTGLSFPVSLLDESVYNNPA